MSGDHVYRQRARALLVTARQICRERNADLPGAECSLSGSECRSAGRQGRVAAVGRNEGKVTQTSYLASSFMIFFM